MVLYVLAAVSAIVAAFFAWSAEGTPGGTNTNGILAFPAICFGALAVILLLFAII
jgi:hypothetical protein